MKFVVSSTALLNVLQTSNKVVSNKNTLPILDNFLFELKDGVLKITASDLETTMIGTLKVDSMEQEGVIAAPVKLMIDSLKEFSEQPLTIEANESTWEIQISWKTGKLAIPGTSGLELPDAARARRRDETGNLRRHEPAAYGHQQNDFRDGRRRAPPGDERRVRQHRTAGDHLRGDRRPQAGQVRRLGRNRYDRLFHPAQKAG